LCRTKGKGGAAYSPLETVSTVGKKRWGESKWEEPRVVATGRTRVGSNISHAVRRNPLKNRNHPIQTLRGSKE